MEALMDSWRTTSIARVLSHAYPARSNSLVGESNGMGTAESYTQQSRVSKQNAQMKGQRWV